MLIERSVKKRIVFCFTDVPANLDPSEELSRSYRRPPFPSPAVEGEGWGLGGAILYLQKYLFLSISLLYSREFSLSFSPSLWLCDFMSACLSLDLHGLLGDTHVPVLNIIPSLFSSSFFLLSSLELSDTKVYET